MGFKCGIVGLPNVGKSTLFNALTQSQAAEGANFPFTTVEPHIGDTPNSACLVMKSSAALHSWS